MAPKFTPSSQPDGFVFPTSSVCPLATSYKLKPHNQAAHLQSKSLEIILVANHGYTPGLVNFSCRIARCARDRSPPVNIIASLKAVADLDASDLKQRMGESFARGHKEASGGIVPEKEFEELMALMKVGEKPDPIEGEGEGRKKAPTANKAQKNNLMNYFGKG